MRINDSSTNYTFVVYVCAYLLRGTQHPWLLLMARREAPFQSPGWCISTGMKTCWSRGTLISSVFLRSLGQICLLQREVCFWRFRNILLKYIHGCDKCRCKVVLWHFYLNINTKGKFRQNHSDWKFQTFCSKHMDNKSYILFFYKKQFTKTKMQVV